MRCDGTFIPPLFAHPVLCVRLKSDFFCRICSLLTDDEFYKHKNIYQKLNDKLILEFLCQHSVIFWIDLHLLYLIL